MEKTQTDIKTERQTGRLSGRHIDIQRKRHSCRQTHKNTHGDKPIDTIQTVKQTVTLSQTNTDKQKNK